MREYLGVLEGSKLLARQLLRQFIWETLNRHRSEGDADIALVGSRRSGSTLLMQVIAHQKGMKAIDQPFSVFTATGPQMKFLPWPGGGFFLHPDAEEKERIQKYLSALRSGQLHVQEPWRFWRPEFHFRSNRLILKTTDAHFLLPLLAEERFVTALYFRHPVPQAMSCLRNSWGDKLEFFGRNRVFTNHFLCPSQREKLDQLRSEGSPDAQLERYVLSWCLENAPLFEAAASGMPAFFYEDIVLNPEKSLEKMQEVFRISINNRMRAMLGRASGSVKGLSDQEASAAIAEGDKQKLIGRWKAQIDCGTLTRIQGILDLFPGCPYRADSLMPNSYQQLA